MSSTGPELWVVRHGETEWSRDGRHTSVTDLVLTESGEEAATALAPRLAEAEFDLVLTSPRRRARRTAELAGFPAAEVDEDLVEWAYGDYEGVTTEEIREDVPGWTVWTHPTPGGETADEVSARLDRVVRRTREHDRSLVFAHGHSLRVLTARWLEQTAAKGRFFKLDTSTVSVLGYEREHPALLSWNRPDVRIDLHTHSSASDGTDTPGDLVREAAAAGLDVVALTDHDAMSGWTEAQEVADEVGITLVPGLEISTRFGHCGVHLLGYLPDPTHPALVLELDRILEGRTARTPAIVGALRAHGIDISEDDVRRESGGSVAAGRPHVADALARLGVVRDRTEAFATLLSPGQPGYVNRYASALEEMIPLVVAAGGVAVIAHPWGRGSRSVLSAEDLAELKDLGLAGIEVDHQDHSAADRAELRGIATDLDLVVTGSSDHHGLGKVDHDLGVNTTDPEQYERLLSLALTS